MHPVDPWIVIFLFITSGITWGMIGYNIGRRERRRQDEAGRFDHGDIITLTDGSRLRVIETLPKKSEDDHV